MKATIDTLRSVFAGQTDALLDAWREFLQFPSISADPMHDTDCAACADWLERLLARMGFTTVLRSSDPKPVLLCRRPGVQGAPRVLFYGHYDVQPPDPLDLWSHPPFEPHFADGRMQARGAADDKGQVLSALKAIEALIGLGAPLPELTVLLEGEEESGGLALDRVLPAICGQIRADVLMVADTQMPDRETPAVTLGLRGIVNVGLRVAGPLRDLHSGCHGGVAANPAAALARAVASLHDSRGRIAVDGYYRDVAAPSSAERACLDAIRFDRAAYRAATGVDADWGETEFPPHERLGFRPAIDVNGFHSGYGGSGFKTIIPSSAEAKISLRLAHAQDPAWCLEAVVRHLRANLHRGLSLEVTGSSVGGPALRIPPDAPWIASAAAVLREVSGREAARVWEGASIPVIPKLAGASGATPLLVGFSCEGDAIHAPNESFSLDRFRMGYLYTGLLLQSLV